MPHSRFRILAGGSIMKQVCLGTTASALGIVATLWLASAIACRSEGAGQEKEIAPRECLVIKSVGRSGRAVVRLDALEAQILAGKWQAPKAGDSVTLPDGSKQTWEGITAGEDGWFNNRALAGGYAYLAVPAEAERVMLLEAAGHTMVYVNHEPRAGDPYQTGYVRLPVLLHKGINDFLFHGSRGRFRVRLVEPRAPVMLDASDATLPDLIVGEETQAWGALVVINNATTAAEKLVLQASCGPAEPASVPVPTIPPLSTRKVGFRLQGRPPQVEDKQEVKLELVRQTGDAREILDTSQVKVRVRRPDQSHKRTFRSTIDGSVQYYAIHPARSVTYDKASKGAPPRSQTAVWGQGGGGPALFLTLHGAGVEAIGQADAYSPKSWGHLVAPTNRRPFGFDWEDWGRLDALEVLELAQRQLHTDRQRTYLTGHSMGGHGVWHLGALFPDRFAAIGPSAGWISVWSYAGAKKPGNASAMQEMLLRAAGPSDTLALVKNYAQHGVYILHGAADDNVPADQARTMKQQLSGFHHDFVYHEQPKVGHWWDLSKEPGADCVDWAPMFDFFARRIRPGNDSVRQIDFVTANPGISAWSHWVGIEAQIEQLKPSSVSIRHDPGLRRFVGTTNNVARLAIDLRHVEPGKAIQVELDDQELPAIPFPEDTAKIWLQRDGDDWEVATEPSAKQKGPHRYGPFKDAFRNQALFVYGTAGTPEENAWAFAKARYDAETFWYRGNGSIDIISDKSFEASASRDRNVILYGNAETNGAWRALLADSPVQVERGRVRVGDGQESRELRGEDLACLFLRPRPGSERAAVGVVSGSGITGMRLTDRLPYFLSGVGLPDCLVIGTDMLTNGEQGVRLAGFFGLDWNVSSGDFVWSKPRD
jgi:dienelactone hydrolase